MMFSKYSTTPTVTGVAVAVLLLWSSMGPLTVPLQGVHAQQQQHWNGRATPVTCSICRDPNRPITNPSKSFTMHNGNTWTCDYLQETVQDVDAQSSNPSERLMCAQAQLQGETGGCHCGGAVMAPIQSQVSQLNPACDLCAGQASAVVPSSNYDKTVATGVAGTHNCQGLEGALASGILSSTLCPAIQQAAGATCCASSGGSSSSSSNLSRPPTSSNNNNSNANISYNTGASTSTSSVASSTSVSTPPDNTAGATTGSGNARQSIHSDYTRTRMGGTTTNARGGRTTSSTGTGTGTGTIRGAAVPLP